MLRIAPFAPHGGVRCCCASASTDGLDVSSQSRRELPSPLPVPLMARITWVFPLGTFPLALSTTGVRRGAGLEVLNGINTFLPWCTWCGTLHAHHAHHLTRQTFTNSLPYTRIPHLRTPQEFLCYRLWA